MTDLPFATPPPGQTTALGQVGKALPDQIADLDPEAQARFRKLERLSYLLDSQFTVPGTDFSFGIDAIVGFIPWFGGATGLALSTGVIGQGILVGARGATVLRMLLNALFDAALNAVPVLGYVSDLFFKANERNVKLLATHALDPDRTQAESKRMLGLMVLAIVLGVGLVFALAIGVIAWLISYLF